MRSSVIRANNIPKTSSGKLKRSACKRQYLDNKLDIVAKTDFTSNAYQSDNPLESLFHNYQLTGQEQTTLGDAGLDSIQLAEFAYDLRQYLDRNAEGHMIGTIDLKLLQKINVNELYQLLIELHTHSSDKIHQFRKSFDLLIADWTEKEKLSMKNDVSHFSTLIHATNAKSSEGVGAIFLTGGTGFRSLSNKKHTRTNTTDDLCISSS